MLARIMGIGKDVKPRDQSTKELLGYKSVIPMTQPVIGNIERKLGYHFMAAEAAWILSGDNRVSTIAPFSKAISNFSDDGEFFFGAYGPKIRAQLPHIIRSLQVDLNTRQAVLTIWRECPPASKDIPCTVSMHWMVRDMQLHCFVNMRSSDAWLGVPYDWFNFSMVSAYILLALRKMSAEWGLVELGNLHFYANSQHIYQRDFAGVSVCLDHAMGEKVFAPLDLREFDAFDQGPDALVDHLWNVAKRTLSPMGPSFLQEVDNGEA